MESVWVVAGTAFPIVLFLLVQVVGQRRGWRAGRILKTGTVTAWLWWSTALALAIRQGPAGFIAAAVLVGAIVFSTYVVTRWAWKGIFTNYERYLEERYRERQIR